MKVLIIPSWYPSPTHPSTGIFFYEQARLMARHRPDWSIGLSVWGSHDPRLWLHRSQPLSSLLKFGSKPMVKQKDAILEGNCVEFMTPAFTWTRKIKGGNMKGILQANEQNLERFIAYFGKPDVIHAQVTYPAGVIAQRLSEKYSIPFVITEHQSPFPMPSLRGILHKNLIPTLKAANQVLAVSQALVHELEHYGIVADKATNFIDDQLFIPGQESSADVKTLIAVGRLETQKNYGLLLEAVSLLQKECPVLLKVVGSGSLRRSLQRRAKTLQLNVEWLGECTQHEVLMHLQSAHVFVNTSTHENQPAAILEALACGLSVISTPWQGAEELIDSQAGALAKGWEAAQLQQTISEVLDQQLTKHAVRAYFDHRFGTQRVVDQLESKFQAVITRYSEPD
ncbi:glycosyltransferase [Marinoscillum sp.]|uniref:glycosyltransferase n=1 Tax=Marinoscillum sp. TaxID=2024838 RepID=UPI003BAB17F7